MASRECNFRKALVITEERRDRSPWEYKGTREGRCGLISNEPLARVNCR